MHRRRITRKKKLFEGKNVTSRENGRNVDEWLEKYFTSSPIPLNLVYLSIWLTKKHACRIICCPLPDIYIYIYFPFQKIPNTRIYTFHKGNIAEQHCVDLILSNLIPRMDVCNQPGSMYTSSGIECHSVHTHTHTQKRCNRSLNGIKDKHRPLWN